MLIHVYLFLTTVFVGLQGAALYRHHFKNATQEQKIQIAKEIIQEANEQIPFEAMQLPSIAMVEMQEISIAKDPQEIHNELSDELDIAFGFEAQDSQTNENYLAEEIQEEESDSVSSSVSAVVESSSENEINSEDDIVIFDYASAIKNSPKITSQVNNHKPKNVRNISEKNNNEIDLLLNENKTKQNLLQTAMYYEGEFKFIVAPEINISQLEVRSLVDDEEVHFDRGGKGSIVKNFTSKTATEIFQAIYPMAMPVNVKAYWHQGLEHVIEIPILHQTFMGELYQELNIKGEWGMVLAKIKDDINYFELENHKAYVFLDENLNEIEMDKATYILYLGVPAGNHDLKFLVNNKAINYPLYVTENEISFVDLHVDATEIERTFSIYEKLPLAKIEKDLFINSDQITGITSDAYLEKEALNNYKFIAEQNILGEKETILITNEGQNYFIDTKEVDQKIVIPSKEYINQVLETAKDTDTSCIIEFSPKKKIEYMSTRMFAQKIDQQKGQESFYTMIEMVTERHLDADGIFYPTHSDDTKKIFLLTQDSGLVLVKITYKDGSQETRQYLCEAKDYHLDSTGE